MVKYASAKSSVWPFAHAALDELRALLRDQLTDLLAGGLAQVVGLFERVARELLGHSHELLLVDHQPERGPEDLLEVGVVVADRAATVLALRVFGVPVLRHRARPVQRDDGGDVFEGGRREPKQQRTQRPTLELEHADRVGPAQQLEGLLVVERDVVDVGPAPGGLLDQVERDLDDVEVAQAEEVHLQQAELFDAVHLVLRHHRRVFERGIRLGLALDRQVLGQRLAGDDHRGGVDAVLAAQPFEPARHVDHALGVGVDLVERAQIGGHLVAVGETLVRGQARVQRRVAAHDRAAA